MSQAARNEHELTVLDDFAVPREQESRVREQRARLQALFGVELDVLGVLGRPTSPGERDPQQIWLQLQGRQEDLDKAKNYIKGLCAPEITLSESYPQDMHCIFLGAQGLFLDCLVCATCAHVSVVARGVLAISGLAVAVVMAQSLIQEFVDRYMKNPRLDEQWEVQVKRRFKELVEAHNDKHAMDLLILPSAVKEELLHLVRDAQVHRGSAVHGARAAWDPLVDLAPEGRTVGAVVGPPERPYFPVDLIDMKEPRLQETPEPSLTRPVLHKRASRPIYDFNHTTCSVLGVPLPFPENGYPQTRPGEDAERIPLHLELGGFHDIGTERHGGATAVAQKENRGLGGTSPTSFRLPEVPWGDNSKKREDEQKIEQGEEDHDYSVLLSSGTEKEFNMMVNFFKTMGYQEEAIRKVLFTDGIQEPSQVLDRLQVEKESKKPRSPPTQELEAAAGGYKSAAATTTALATTEDEYVLEVIKSAAKNCGYSPSEITELQEGAPMANLLIQLNQRKERSNLGSTVGGSSRDLHEDPDPQRELFTTPERCAPSMRKTNRAQSQSSPSGPADSEPCFKAATLPKARARLERGETATELLFPEHGWASPKLPVEDVCLSEAVPESAGAEGMAGVSPPRGGEEFPLVTRTQRFTEVMQRPFQLNLKDEPGQDDLRHIIIDGSNVAMIHGLQRFFSCRGIALAVQYFWDRGHRDITVFVPQWRMKKDPKVKEQQFLTQLNELSLLSFTPSRTVAGKRITSYDDRFMLQLAEKTEGVIVTNDNLRDCADESTKWMEIIKHRLLQFTFVGDIFMVPDDPLGRHGPLLDEFLRKTARTKISKSHSSVSHRTGHASPRTSSQTEILHLRDRKPGGVPDDQQSAGSPRSTRDTARLRQQLLPVFIEQKVDFVLQSEPCERDLNKLSELILNLKF